MSQNKHSIMGRLTLLCLALAFVLSTIGCQKVNQTRANRLANKAVKLYRLGSYSKARSYLRQALALYPLNAHALYLLGRTYEKLQDKIKAEQQYKRAIHVEGKDYRPHFQLGKIYYEWKKYALAATHLDKASTLNAKHLLSFYQLGLAQHKLSNFAKAEVALRSAIALNPKFVDAYNALSFVFLDKAEKAKLELGDDQALPFYNKAVGAIQSAKAAGVANEQSYNNLGLVYQKQKKFAEALSAFETALKSKAHFSLAIYNKASTYDQWIEELMKTAEEDKTKTKEMVAKALVYRETALKLFKQFVQQAQGQQPLRGDARTKIMELMQLNEKDMLKRIKRKRKEKRKLKRRR